MFEGARSLTELLCIQQAESVSLAFMMLHYVATIGRSFGRW